MTDKITPFPSRPRLATCTGGVPSENPDSGKPTEDMHPDNLVNVRPLPADLAPADLYQMAQDYQHALEAVDRAAAAYRTALFALAKVLDRNGGGDDGGTAA